VTEGLETLEEIREINAAFPFTPHARRWKEEGGKIVGWICNYVPEEIICAAGLLPVRVTGDRAQVQAPDGDAFLDIYSCSYTRTCFQLAYDRRFAFLDALVGSVMCDGTRHLYDVLENYSIVPVIPALHIPHKFGERAHQHYRREIVRLKEDLEERFGVRISDDALRDAIQLLNETRSLLGKLYAERKSDHPRVSGAEVQAVMNAAVRMPKADFNDALRRLLAEIGASRRELRHDVRLMIDGSILNNVDFVSGVEDLGALVVADGLCTGFRYCDGFVREDIDPMTALASYYLNKFPCPRMSPPTRRFDRVEELIRQHGVDGVIYETIRYCNIHGWDYPMLRLRLEGLGVPVLQLDVEYGLGPTGQIKTRVQAFIEMILERKGGGG